MHSSSGSHRSMAIGRLVAVVFSAALIAVLTAAPAFAAAPSGLTSSPSAGTSAPKAPAANTVAAASTSVAATTTAAAKPVAAAPQLSIAVDNGQKSAAVGDDLAYTITIRNLGAKPVTGLLVTQSLPTGLKFGSADARGQVKAGAVHWQVDLKAAGEATFHSKMTVLATPADLLRLATVACASIAPDGSPIVCASHSDQLPAGATATLTAGSSGAADRTWWYAGGGIVVVILAALAAVAVWRRRRATTVG